MRSSAVDPIGRVRVDDVRDPYRAEQLRAQMRADRVARPQAPFARIQATRQLGMAAAASVQKPVVVRKDDPDESINPLRDQYTAHCLMNAIQAFHDQQARLEALVVAVNQALKDEQVTLQARAEAANDLGTIQGLLPQQPYRYAVGIPQILPQQLAAATGASQVMVAPVTHAATSRSTTDNAFGTDPDTRARTRNPRDTGAGSGAMGT
ncbi:hypothetical protein [Achromobacter deleyi]|uniref:hypothetical protein n=1 Tax=Achromobacter deleyi TaxID=1353891 RepID=UPI001492AF8B|nr:hypothetical protein [Achromobacter deleyi]QVQ24698.1 hypothetical protein HLG70_17575 [Achromobacter deleyi]UIP20234.1 hypothetical protein LYZ39_25185 [Achromobacter deleyi]